MFTTFVLNDSWETFFNIKQSILFFNLYIYKLYREIEIQILKVNIDSRLNIWVKMIKLQLQRSYLYDKLKMIHNIFCNNNNILHMTDSL